MKHIELFEFFNISKNQQSSILEASINDWGKENLVGKKIKFPKGKLRVTFVQWRGESSSMGHYDETVNPEEIFTVTKLEKVYWGYRGEKSTSPLLFVKNKSGNEYMLTAMDHEPVEVVE
jgi:hypothetical protein